MTEFFIKLLADGLVVPIVLLGGAALLLYIPSGQRYKAYCRILMAGLTAYLLAKLIGSVYQPELTRPFQQLGLEAKAAFLDNPGFPSDHMLFCSAITLAVWFETRKKKLSILLAGLTLLVGVGRVLALVHTPLDVAGGIVIASVGAIWYLQNDRIRKPHKTRQWSKPQ